MYREEYPRPNFVREAWQNLNGSWQFDICDNRDLDIHSELEKNIEVPFCPESKLSGIQHKDFMKEVIYRRTFEIKKEELKGRVILNFGAVDYMATVYINKNLVGTHSGGYVSFSFDITDYLNVGENIIDVIANDDTRSLNIPSGKQSLKKDSHNCFYTRTTGIWQTVWLEFLHKCYMKTCLITPDVDTSSIKFVGEVSEKCELVVTVSLDGKLVKKESFAVNGNFTLITDLHCDINLWSGEKPTLYDIVLSLESNGETCDHVVTYCGFRKVEIKGKYFYLNGKKTMLKQVLDQGFYPDGVYTAEKVEDIYADIDFALELGFNGVRPHEKVFEPHYLYYADKKGVLLLGEYPNWSCDFRSSNKEGVSNLLREWDEVLERDYNHPSIIGWCPLNEAWLETNQKCDYKSQTNIIEITRVFDPTRFVIGASGGDIYGGDIWDFHTYVHDGAKLKKIIRNNKYSIEYFFHNLFCTDKSKKLTFNQLNKLPKFLSEYGGMTFMQSGKTWGYSKAFVSEEDFVDKFVELTQIAIDSDIMGICYTQLYDVEQEQNGFLQYDRSFKISSSGVEKIRNCLLEVNSR